MSSFDMISQQQLPQIKQKEPQTHNASLQNIRTPMGGGLSKAASSEATESGCNTNRKSRANQQLSGPKSSYNTTKNTLSTRHSRPYQNW